MGPAVSFRVNTNKNPNQCILQRILPILVDFCNLDEYRWFVELVIVMWWFFGTNSTGDVQLEASVAE
jgi:hypothetical protein